MATTEAPAVERDGFHHGSDPGMTRIRSHVACRDCNRRKVRCDVARTGEPCSNCKHQATTCVVLPRKKHRPRKSRIVLPSSHSESPQYHNLPSAGAEPARANGSVTSPHVHVALGNDGFRHDYNARRVSTSELSPSGSQQAPWSSRQPVAKEQDGNNGTLATVLDADTILPDDSSLSYIGDKRGSRSFVYEICHPGAPQDAGNILLSKASNVSRNQHEIDYMQHMGVYSMPSDDVCDDLIRCYFQHVHFFLPIVDAPGFLNEYISNGYQNISLLLFWTMLLAGANFVESEVLQKAGYSSRKAMKSAMYERAKCLYDFDHGTDKLILIQSVILMGFWYTDLQDHTGAWYWIGIAISLSQTLGLHRSPQTTTSGQPFPEARQRLVRRIWWTCLVRDRWLSLAKGRPMRIHHEDCDIPLPIAEDVLEELSSVSFRARSNFIPAESEVLSKMWIRLVKISATLGNILRVHYRANGPTPCIEDIAKHAQELKLCAGKDALPENPSVILQLHAYQLELFHAATVVVLYRSYVLNGPTALPFEVQALWQKKALDQARAAASDTNSLLEKLIDLDAVQFLRPMIITALIPAMQIHLFDCKSSLSLTRGLGGNKLRLCMLVLAKLGETYWSAGVIYRLFDRAQYILATSHSDTSNTAQKPTTVYSIQAPQAKTQHRIEFEQQKQQQETQQQQQHQRQALPLLSEEAAPLWFNDSPYFSSVDQLLGPGFSLPDDAFQSLFMNYENGFGEEYAQNVLQSHETPIDLLYNV